MNYFKDKQGNNHNVDNSGNHFINGKCVNPHRDSKDKIGSTVPPESERQPAITRL